MEWTQVGIFAINIGVAFVAGILWQKVNGHDRSLEHGRDRMEAIEKKIDKLIVQVTRMNSEADRSV